MSSDTYCSNDDDDDDDNDDNNNNNTPGSIIRPRPFLAYNILEHQTAEKARTSTLINNNNNNITYAFAESLPPPRSF